MAWLDLVVPSAALLALFGVVALLVVAILQGRKVRRLEERLARSGDSAVEAPLARIAELQARHQVSSGAMPSSGQMRTAGIVALIAIALVAAIGGVWYLFVRDEGGATAQEPPAAATTSTGTTPVAPPTPVDTTKVPEDVPVIADKSVVSVTVFNATAIAGSASQAGDTLTNEGWSVPLVANEPDGVTDFAESVVMFTKGNRRAAWNVAKDLGITRAPPLEGYTNDEIGDADVVVVVGEDLATGTLTPSP